jgi:Family of unknown function (DUF6314)
MLDLLIRVQTISFIARSGKPNGWNGQGRGIVETATTTAGAVTFGESGVWRSVDGNESRFRNTFRWSVIDNLVRLEHLRFGEGNPVHLFDLAQVGEQEWKSASPHLCRDDCYAAVLLILEDCIEVRWSIDGPKKQQAIEYVYRW